MQAQPINIQVGSSDALTRMCGLAVSVFFWSCIPQPSRGLYRQQLENARFAMDCIQGIPIGAALVRVSLDLIPYLFVWKFDDRTGLPTYALGARREVLDVLYVFSVAVQYESPRTRRDENCIHTSLSKGSGIENICKRHYSCGHPG